MTPEVVLYRYLQLVNAEDVHLPQFVDLVGMDADLLSRWLLLLHCPAQPAALQQTIAELEPWTFVDLAQAQAWSVLPPGGSARLGFDQWRSVLQSAMLGEILAEELGLPEPTALRWRLHLAMSGVSLGTDSELKDLIEFRGTRTELLEDAPLPHRILAVLDALEMHEEDSVASIAERLLGINGFAFGSLVAQASERLANALVGAGLDAASTMDHTEDIWHLQQVNLLAGLFLRAGDPNSLFAAHELAAKTLFRITPELFAVDAEDPTLLSNARSPSREPGAIAHEIPLNSVSSHIAKALRDHQDLRIADNTDCAIADRQVLRRLATHGGLVIPLFVKNEAFGVLVFASDEEVDQGELQHTYAMALSRWLGTARDAGGGAQGQIAAFREREEKRLRELVHEVNNPLSIVSNYLHILELRLQEEPSTKDQLGIISRELRRASELLQQAVNVPRAIDMDEPKAKVSLTDFDINELARQVHEIHLGYAAEHRTSLELDLQHGSLLLRNDQNRVTQILNNLLKNAIEAGGGIDVVRVNTRGGVYRAGQRGVEVQIIDNGPGLSDAVLERLYEPKQSTKGGAHAGLGLHIVHRLVKEIDASIDLRTEAGVGTEFTLFLPLS